MSFMNSTNCKPLPSPYPTPPPPKKNPLRIDPGVFTAFFLNHPFMKYFGSTLIYTMYLSPNYLKQTFYKKNYPSIEILFYEKRSKNPEVSTVQYLGWRSSFQAHLMYSMHWCMKAEVLLTVVSHKYTSIHSLFSTSNIWIERILIQIKYSYPYI